MYRTYESASEKIARFIQKYKWIVIAISALIIGLIIYLIIPKNNFDMPKTKYTKLEQEIIKHATEYIENNLLIIDDIDGTFISFEELNYQFDDPSCNDKGGVIAFPNEDTYSFELYYSCENVISTTIKEYNSDADEITDYFQLKGDYLVFTDSNKEYVDEGYDSSDDSIEVTAGYDIGKETGIYHYYYGITIDNIEYEVTRFIYVQKVDENDVVTPIVVPTNPPTLVLVGKQNVVLEVDEEYIEPGYKALDDIDGDITDSVIIEGEVLTDTVGQYTLTYIITNSSTLTTTATRSVSVVEKGAPRIELLGSSIITLYQGDKYKEPGYKAYDSSNKDITYKVKVDSDVDLAKPGIYEIEYSVDIDGSTTSVIRTIEVKTQDSEINIELSKNLTDYTRGNVIITVKLSGSAYDYVIMPNGSKHSERLLTYEVSTNGTYVFKAYNKAGREKKATIKIDNIDKTPPIGSCKIDAKKVFIVNAEDNESGLKDYAYGLDGIYSAYTTGTTFTTTRSGVATVKVRDNALNEQIINCTEEKPAHDLEVHMVMVGDGDAIVIRSSTQVIAIDGSRNGAKKFVKYLKELGVSKLDAYIGTHYPDGDHIGAVPQVFKNFEVTKTYLSGNPPLKGGNADLDPIRGKVTVAKAGDELDFNGEMKIIFVGPIKRTSACIKKGYPCSNYDSLNFILIYGNTKFFFTGDYVHSDKIIKKFDRELLSNVDFIKQPHHGLHDYISKKLINIMKPSIVFVPDGRDHMSSKMKGWYSSIGANVYHTCNKKSQNLLAISDGEKVTVKRNVKAKNYAR